jgi:hypothetical protein
MSSFPVFARSVCFCIVFAHHCVSACLFVCWPLYYQFFFDWRLLITTLVSSSCSFNVMFFVVIFRCFNIAESVDHHCLNFPFIAYYYFFYWYLEYYFYNRPDKHFRFYSKSVLFSYFLPGIWFPYGRQDDTRYIKNAGNDKEYEYIICFTINRDWNFSDKNNMLHIN